MESTVQPEAAEPRMSFYEAVGGEETFTKLVTRFYAEVAADPVLRAVYPSKDLGPATEHLRLFLMQYWGGPDTYNELRGHPRLRMRHKHFSIGQAERGSQQAGRLRPRGAADTAFQITHRPRAHLGSPGQLILVSPAFTRSRRSSTPKPGLV